MGAVFFGETGISLFERQADGTESIHTSKSSSLEMAEAFGDEDGVSLAVHKDRVLVSGEHVSGGDWLTVIFERDETGHWAESVVTGDTMDFGSVLRTRVLRS